MNQYIKSSDIIYATDYQEFFWKENDLAVEEGVAVGYEATNSSNDNSDEVVLTLFHDIYHEFKEEIF